MKGESSWTNVCWFHKENDDELCTTLSVCGEKIYEHTWLMLRGILAFCWTWLIWTPLWNILKPTLSPMWTHARHDCVLYFISCLEKWRMAQTHLCKPSDSYIGVFWANNKNETLQTSCESPKLLHTFSFLSLLEVLFLSQCLKRMMHIQTFVPQKCRPVPIELGWSTGDVL